MSIEKHLLLGYKNDLPEDIAKTIADYIMEMEEQKDSIEDKLMEIFNKERLDRNSSMMHMIESAMMAANDFSIAEPEEAVLMELKKNGHRRWIINTLMRNPFTLKQYVMLYKNDKEMIDNFIKYVIHCRYYHTHPA